MEPIKLVTLNTWSGFRYHGLVRLEEYETPQVRQTRLEGLLAFLHAEQPDIVCLNELNPLFPMLREIASHTGLMPFGHMGVAGVRVGSVGFPLNLREGDGVFVRESLAPKWVGRAHLGGKGMCGNTVSFHFDNLTQALLVRCTLPGGNSLYVCGTHFTAAPVDDAENRARLEQYAQETRCSKRRMFRAGRKLSAGSQLRREEAGKLLRFLEAHVPLDAPVLIAGDLNAECGWAELNLLACAGYRPLLPEPSVYTTWDSVHNTNVRSFYAQDAARDYHDPYKKLEAADEMARRNIDHVFVRNLPPGAVRRCRIAATEPYQGRSISDHFALTAEFML